MVVYSSVYRLFGEGGEMYVEASGDRILFDIVSGHRHLGVSVDAMDFLEVLASMIVEDGLLLQTRCVEWSRYTADCFRAVRVPNMGALAALLEVLADVLRKAPLPAKDPDTKRWVWSPEEERAAKRAAMLLEDVARLLRHPAIESAMESEEEKAEATS